MWFEKFKKKKLQCLLIGLLIFISALIFSSSISIITSVNNYVENYYANSKFYNMFIYSAKESSKEEIYNWCKNNSNIKDIKSYQTLNSGNNIYYKNNKIKVSSYDLIKLNDYKDLPYGISKIKSLNNNDAPGEDEIWVTQLFCNTYKISLGDTLKLNVNGEMKSLKITTVINDSLQPSSTVSAIMFYINEKNYKDFSSLPKRELILIDTQKNADSLKLEKNLTTDIKTGGYAGTKDILIQSSTMISSLMGGAAACSSILVFIVTIFLIRFIVWNNILKEYKSIGVYKALGFTKKEILKFYITGYSLTAIIGSILGSVCSIIVLNLTGSKVLRYIGNFKGMDINISVLLFTIFIFSVIVILNLYFVIKRTRKITPVAALRTGITSSKKKLVKSIVKNSSSPLALSVNDIFKYKKLSFCIFLSLTFSLFLIIFFGNLNYTTLKMKDNPDTWFGIPKSDVTISSSSSSTIKEFNNALDDIKNDKRVESYVYGTLYSDNITIDTKKYNLKNNFCGINAFNSFDSLDGTIIKGHNPKNNKEIAVTLNILKDSGLSIGDYIELSINGTKKSFLITGYYNTLMSEGYVIRILNNSEMKNDLFNEIFINLKDNVNKKQFEKDFNKKFNSMDADDVESNIRYTIESIPGLITPITSLLMISFAVFSLIIVFNIIIMNMKDNRKIFGIMKALGYKSCDIRNRYLYKVMILTGISIVFAVSFNLMFSKNLFMLMMSGQDVLIVSKMVIIISVMAMLILVVSVVLACTGIIKNTKPSELIEE